MRSRYDFEADELAELLESEPPYRARQVFEGLHRGVQGVLLVGPAGEHRVGLVQEGQGGVALGPGQGHPVVLGVEVVDEGEQGGQGFGGVGAVGEDGMAVQIDHLASP